MWTLSIAAPPVVKVAGAIVPEASVPRKLPSTTLFPVVTRTPSALKLLLMASPAHDTARGIDLKSVGVNAGARAIQFDQQQGVVAKSGAIRGGA